MIDIIHDAELQQQQNAIVLCTPDDAVDPVIPKYQNIGYKQIIQEGDQTNYGNIVKQLPSGKKYFDRGDHCLWEFPYDSYTKEKANTVKRYDFVSRQIDNRNKIIYLDRSKNESYKCYRNADIIRCLQKGEWLVLVAEGEKCVEQLLSINILATTFQASDWKKDSILQAFLELKNLKKLGGIACFYDGDETGFKHALDCEEQCKYLGIPFKLISPELFKQNPPKGYDIGDWIEENENITIAEKQALLSAIIEFSEVATLEKEAYIKSPEETEKCFIAAILRACESVHKIASSATKAKSQELLLNCADQIDSSMIQDQEIAEIWDWYRMQITSGIYPTYQSARNNYLFKVSNYYRIESKYKLDFLAKEIKSNYAKRMFNSEANNVLHGRSDGANLRLILDDLLENESTFENKINHVLEEYPTATEVQKFKIEQRLKKQFKLQHSEVEKLIKAHSVSTDPGVPTWMNIQDFLEQDSNSDKFLYPELLLAGRVNLMAGGAGTGKSSFCLDLAASWVLDEPFMSELPSRTVKPKMAIFVNSDQSFNDLQGYCRKNPRVIRCGQTIYGQNGEFRKIQVVGNTHANGSPITLPQFGEFAKNITELAEDYELLIVIDSLSGMNSHNPSFDDTKPDAANAVSLFKTLCDRTGATALMIHHAVKDQFATGRNKCRGHSRIFEESSSLLIMDQIKDEKSGRVVAQFLEIPKMRQKEPRKFRLEHDSRTFSYALTDGLDKQTSIRVNLAQSDLLSIMQKLPGKHDINTLMRNFSIGNKAHAEVIQKAFDKLIARSFVKTHFDVAQNQTTYSLIP
jgi:hypothetical protein